VAGGVARAEQLADLRAYLATQLAEGEAKTNAGDEPARQAPSAQKLYRLHLIQSLNGYSACCCAQATDINAHLLAPPRSCPMFVRQYPSDLYDDC